MTFFSEPDKQYHRMSGLNMTAHLLIAAFQSVDEFKTRMTTPREDTHTFEFGRLAHTLLLEPEKFDAKIGGPVNPRTGKTFGRDSQKFRAWADEQPGTVVTPEEHALATRMAASVRRHKAASKLLAVGEPEQVARARYADMPCQIRCDWIARCWIVDYKTTSDVYGFAAAIEQYGYLIQGAFYQAVAEIVTGRRLPYYIIATEKSDEAPTVVFQLNEKDVAEQRRRNEAKLREIRSDFLRINETRADVSLLEQRAEEVFSLATEIV